MLDEIRLFFVRAMGSEAVTLHARLVDRLGNPKEIRDGYALRWLPWHLGKAGRDTERRALLVNVEWIMAKLKGADIQSLIADYEYLPSDRRCFSKNTSGGNRAGLAQGDALCSPSLRGDRRWTREPVILSSAVLERISDLARS